MGKIVFVLGELPYPLDKGAKIRTFYLLSSLCKNHEVYLFGLEESKKDEWKISELKKFCSRVMVFEREMKKEGLRFCRDLLLNIFSGWPYLIRRGYSRAMADEIRKTIKENSVDLIICDSLQQTPNVLGIKNLPKILNTHNVESVIRRRHCEVEKNALKKAYLSLQLAKLEKYESDTMRVFDYALTVSENDKELMAGYGSYPKSRISVVPNGVDCDYFRPQTVDHRPNSLVFTGSMDWVPNDDAMLYFLKDIWPGIRQRIPDISLTIAGRNPSARLGKEAALAQSVKLTGYVDDIRPSIAKSELYIVPLRMGGGTRLKILEAMAMQKPVVSTSIGCEGLEVTDGNNIVIADGGEQFVNSVIALLKDKDKARRIAMNGRNLAEERYEWKVVTENLESLVEGLC